MSENVQNKLTKKNHNSKTTNDKHVIECDDAIEHLIPIQVLKLNARYLAWADNDATSRSNWSGTQINACIRLWTAPLMRVCTSLCWDLTLLNHF